MRAKRSFLDRQSGFTLVELTIALVVIGELLLAVLMLFNFSYRISHVQTNMSDMQQALRVAQTDIEPTVRMAGRGSLPFTITAPGGAVYVRNNVPTASHNIAVGDATSPLVVDNTDVLTVRGVISAPVFQTMGAPAVVYRDNLGSVTVDPTQAVTGILTINAVTQSGVPQSLQALSDAVTGPGAVPEALILVSSRTSSTFAVVELNPALSNVVVGTSATLAFTVKGNTLANAYGTLYPGGPTLPSGLTRIGYVGILEEYRYYVRNAATTSPKLSRARFMPATETAWGPTGNAGNSANLQNDIADGILDFQVALGFDTTNHVPRSGGEPAGYPTSIAADSVNGYISEAANGQNDDWLYNGTTDDATNALWAASPLYYVRLSLLARTARVDPAGYEAPALDHIEDHVYAAGDPLNVANASGGTQRRYRRRILQITIELRNVT